jgi:hypothetical protein
MLNPTMLGGLVQGIGADCVCSQGRKKRQHGNEAVKSHILAAKTVANIVKTSLVRTHGIDIQARAYSFRALVDSTRS